MRETRDEGKRYAFARQAFRASIARRQIDLTVNHRLEHIMASQDNGSLGLSLGRHGLYFSAMVRDAGWAAHLRKADGSGRLRGCSIGWHQDVVGDEDAGGVVVIRIARVDEITVLIGDRAGARQPAFEGTTVWIADEADR